MIPPSLLTAIYLYQQTCRRCILDPYLDLPNEVLFLTSFLIIDSFFTKNTYMGFHMNVPPIY